MKSIDLLIQSYIQQNVEHLYSVNCTRFCEKLEVRKWDAWQWVIMFCYELSYRKQGINYRT